MDGGSGGDRDVLPGRQTRQDLIGSDHGGSGSRGETEPEARRIFGNWDLPRASSPTSACFCICFCIASNRVRSELQCTASAILHGSSSSCSSRAYSYYWLPCVQCSAGAGNLSSVAVAWIRWQIIISFSLSMFT